MEESIFYECLEVLDDIHYDGCSVETSGIISDVYVLLDVHEDQHVSFENSDVYEKKKFAVDISPGYGTEADVVWCSYEENVEDISVPQLDVLSSPVCEE